MPRPSRITEGVVCAILAAVALGVLVRIHDFGQTRFFTIDEYQWGHATWLVSQGRVPYRDFYEHHLPLGYVLHAPLVGDGNRFVERALRLRTITFAWLLAALAAATAATFTATRSAPLALLTACLTPSVGFGLMSAIDYRGDNWAAFALVACLSCIEIARRHAGRLLSAAAGVLLALAIGMTQKIVLLGGGAVAILWLASVAARSPRVRARLGTWRIASPAAFAAGAAAVAVPALVAGLATGIVGRALEINVLDALRHESLYPGFGVGQFLAPFLEETWASTAALAALAGVHLAGGPRSFWALPLGVALAGGLLVRAPFPYNYVLLCWLVAIAAVRGYGRIAERLVRPIGTGSRLAAAAPLLYLLPLAVLPGQLGFVAGTSDNTGQLRLLEQVERHTGPDDVVIDSAGSALFRPDRGYYWYHGRAHVRMFPAWFARDLVPGMRASRAIFWIRTVRFDLLPDAAQRYLLTHYVPFFGDLHVLGFTTRPAAPAGATLRGRIDVVRSGDYSVAPVDAASGAGDPAVATGLRIDGAPVVGPTHRLEAGVHTLEIAPGTPAYRFSFLPLQAAPTPAPDRPHTRLFELRRARRPDAGGRP